MKEKPHSTYDKVLETILSLQMNGLTFLNSARKDGDKERYGKRKITKG